MNDAFNYHQQATGTGHEWVEVATGETNDRQIHGVSVQSRRNPRTTLISTIVSDIYIRYTLHATASTRNSPILPWIYGSDSPSTPCPVLVLSRFNGIDNDANLHKTQRAKRYIFVIKSLALKPVAPVCLFRLLWKKNTRSRGERWHFLKKRKIIFEKLTSDEKLLIFVEICISQSGIIRGPIYWKGFFFFFLLTWEINRHFTAIEFTRVWTNITWQIFFSSLQRCDHLHHTYKFTFRITWIIVAEFSTKAQNC